MFPLSGFYSIINNANRSETHEKANANPCDEAIIIKKTFDENVTILNKLHFNILKGPGYFALVK